MKNNKLVFAIATCLMLTSVSCFAFKRKVAATTGEQIIAASCGGVKEYRACTDKYPEALSTMAQDGFVLQDIDVDLAEKAVAFTKTPCACLAGSNPDFKREIAFAKTRLPAMIKSAKAQ